MNYKYLILYSILSITISTNISCKKDNLNSSFETQYNAFTHQLNEIIKENENAAKTAANLISNKNIQPKYPKSAYYKDRTGVLADHKHKTKSNIYITADTKITSKTWDIIQRTEQMEDEWDKILTKHPLVGWQYLTEKETKVTRTYPWLDEVRYIGSFVDYTKAPQWEIVKPKNNSKQESKCTHIYFDHDGLGNMISCVSPIIINKQFSGNMSIDLPIKKFFSNLQSTFNQDIESCSFVLDKNNKIIIGTSSINKLELCQKIINQEVFIDHLDQKLNNNKAINTLTYGNKSYHIYRKFINHLDSLFYGIYF